MSRTESIPKVSVCIMTYNQFSYIRHCIQSILEQEANFEFEVIIGDDCSTDGTREIVLEFAEKYPTIIKPILHKQNVGVTKNYFDVHKMAKGDYVAHLDGDDYALPGKLQAQSDYLDANPNCSITWHRMYSLFQNEGQFYRDNFLELGFPEIKFNIDDLLMNITIGLHSSKMYRRNIDWVQMNNHLSALDFSETVLLLHSVGGHANFIDDHVYGVYRAGLGISKNTSYIRKLIYDWLYYFYCNQIGDRSIINAKLFWMTLSDLKHRQNSIYHGMIIFTKTLMSFKPLKVWYLYKHMYQASIKYEFIKPWDGA